VTFKYTFYFSIFVSVCLLHASSLDVVRLCILCTKLYGEMCRAPACLHLDVSQKQSCLLPYYVSWCGGRETENYHSTNTVFLVVTLMSVVGGVFIMFALMALCYRSVVVHKNFSLCLRLVFIAELKRYSNCICVLFSLYLYLSISLFISCKFCDTYIFDSLRMTEFNSLFYWITLENFCLSVVIFQRSSFVNRAEFDYFSDCTILNISFYVYIYLYTYLKFDVTINLGNIYLYIILHLICVSCSKKKKPVTTITKME
jgi:hypothetical protein